MCRATQCGCGGSQPCCTLIASFCADYGGYAFQAPGGIGGIAQPLVDRQALVVAPLRLLIVLLLSCQVPQQGEDIGDAPGHLVDTHQGESFLQKLGGTYDLPALACNLAKIEQGKAHCSHISCAFGYSITFSEVGSSLLLRTCSQSDGTEHSQYVADVGLISRSLGQRQCLSG